MLNITKHKGNANNPSEIIPHTHCQQNKTVNTDEDAEQLKLLHTVGGIIKWCSHYGKQYGGV